MKLSAVIMSILGLGMFLIPSNLLSFEMIPPLSSPSILPPMNEGTMNEGSSLSEVDVPTEPAESDSLHSVFLWDSGIIKDLTATPESAFITDSLLELYFPNKQTFNHDELTFLHREVSNWLSRDYTLEQLQEKFEIRKQLLPLVMDYLYGYLPNVEDLADKGIQDFDLLNLSQKEVLYFLVEKLAAGIENGEGIVPSGVLVDDVISKQYTKLARYVAYDTTHVIQYGWGPQTPDYNALWNVLNESQDFTTFKALTFLIKADNPEVIPYVRLEFDVEGTPQEPISVALKDVAKITSLGPQWYRVDVDLDKLRNSYSTELDWSKINVFSIVLKKEDLEAAGLPLRGTLVFKDIYLASKNPEVKTLPEVKDDLEFILANKKFLESVEIPYLVPARPLILDVKEDRELLLDFCSKVQEIIDQNPDLSLSQAQERAWALFQDRVLQANQNIETLKPFISEYIGANLDLARVDHQGYWQWYVEQVENGVSIGHLKRRLALGIILKPFIERMLGVGFSPYGIDKGKMSEFVKKYRSYGLITADYELPTLLEEIVKKIAINYFIKTREMGGTRDYITGLSYDSPTGRDLSIAATGFQLSWIPVAAEFNWINPEGGLSDNKTAGYALAKQTLSTILNVLRELNEYEEFLSDYLKEDVRRVAEEKGVEILERYPQGKPLTPEEEVKLHNLLRIEEELRKEKESEILKAYLEREGLFDQEAQKLYSSDPTEFLWRYSPIYKYGRYGMVFRYLTPNGKGDFAHNRDPGNDAGVVDNAILHLGVLAVREYFKDHPDLVEMADEILSYPKWSYFVNADGNHPNQLAMGWYVHTSDFTDAYWNVYTDEAFITHVLGVASSTYPISPEVFYSIHREERDIEGYKFIASWSNSLFTKLLKGIWFTSDFTDREGIDWMCDVTESILANKFWVMESRDRSATWSASLLNFPITTGATPGIISAFEDPTRKINVPGYNMDSGFGNSISGHDFPMFISAVNGLAQVGEYMWDGIAGLVELLYRYPRVWNNITGFADAVSEDEGLGYEDCDYWTSPTLVGFSEGLYLSLANLLARLNDKTSVQDLVSGSDYYKTFLLKIGAEENESQQVPELSLQPSSGFQEVVDNFIQEYNSNPSAWASLYDSFSTLLEKASTFGDFDLLISALNEAYRRDSEDYNANLLNILIAQTALEQMRKVGEIATGRVYKGTPVQKATEMMVKYLDEKMILAKDVLNRINVELSDIWSVRVYGLATAIYKNSRDYFSAMRAYDYARTFIYTPNVPDFEHPHSEELARLYAETFNRYDLIDGVTQNYTVEDILHYLQNVWSIEAPVVCYPFLAKELCSQKIELNPIFSYDAGDITYFVDRYENGESLEDIISWIITEIYLKSGGE